MLESEKLAIAAHLHVVMRRKVGRVTDVEWLLKSPEYAREIIRIAQAETGHPELLDWSNRLKDALFPAGSASLGRGRSAADAPSSRLDEMDSHEPSGFADSRLGRGAAPAAPKPAPPARYIGSLR